MKYLSILTIISTTTVWSTTIEPTEKIASQDPLDKPVDIAPSPEPIGTATATTQIPTDFPACAATLACRTYPHWNSYQLTFERISRMKHSYLSYQPSDERLLPYISGGSRRYDLWPGHGFLHLSECIATSTDAKLHVAEVSTDGSAVERGPRAKRTKVESTSSSAITTAPSPFVQRVVVKYGTDCKNVLFNPLVREYIFRKIINATYISPKVYYLSPAAQMTSADLPLSTARFVGHKLEGNLVECARNGTTVRFMVQERAGPSLQKFAAHHTLNRSAAFAKGMLRIARRLLDNLEALHSLGIVHGDIHAANFVFRRPVKDSSQIDSIDFRLIDFEHASFFPLNFGHPKNGQDYSEMSPRHLSIWQLFGERVGPRDDVYRLVYMLADILSKNRLRAGVGMMLDANEYLFSITSRDSDEYRELESKIELLAKKNFPLFRHSPELGSKAFTGLPNDLDRSVADKLEAIHTHIVSTYVDPDMEVNYTLIRAMFDEVIALFP